MQSGNNDQTIRPVQTAQPDRTIQPNQNQNRNGRNKPGGGRKWKGEPNRDWVPPKEIRVGKSDEEEANRQYYKRTADVQRKWFEIYEQVNDHGDEDFHEKTLLEAFKLVELVMDNFIEKFYIEHLKPNQYKIEDEFVFRYEGIPRRVDYTKKEGGFGGKIWLLESMQVVFPKGINKMRENRNSFAHSTATFKELNNEFIKNFAEVKKRIDLLGEMLVIMKYLPESEKAPSYEQLKLQVGHGLGFGKSYTILELLEEKPTERIFLACNNRERGDFLVREWIPTGSPVVEYEKNKILGEVRGNGIVRTVKLLLQNQTSYIVLEKIPGIPFAEYVGEHRNEPDKLRELLRQIAAIERTLDTYPDIVSDLDAKDLIVDNNDVLWLTTYDVGHRGPTNGSIAKRYEAYFGLMSEPEEDEVCEPEEVFVQEEVEEPAVQPLVTATPAPNADQSRMYLKPVTDTSDIALEKNENDWLKVFGTCAICLGMTLIFWAISHM